MPNQADLLDGITDAPVAAQVAQVTWWVINDGASADVVALMREKTVKHPEKVKVFIDHDTPCGSVEAALLQKALIEFARENGCELFNGRGISHQIMLDTFVKPGDVVAGCFSHGAMYGAVNAFGASLSPKELAQSLQSGEAALTVPQTVHIRLEGSLAFPASEKDLALFLRAHSEYGIKNARIVFSGPGAVNMPLPGRIALCQMLDADLTAFEDEAAADFTLELSTIVPTVSGPNCPDTLSPAPSLSDKTVNEVFIGGCSGGRIEDLRHAAFILAGRRVPPRVRLMIAPATTEVYEQAANEGLLATFLDAGAILMNQGCSVCWGKSQGIVDDGEVLLSAGSRCFKGCAGAESAEVYLCSPIVAAYSALAGSIRIAMPEGGC